jgi:cell wall assembly regulator SMI1
MEHPLMNLDYELEYFTNKKGITLYDPATKEAINAAEETLGCNLSPQMKSFFIVHSGGRILEMSIQGVPSLGLRQLPKDINILYTNQLLRALPDWEPFWLYLGSDGFGNYFVADTNQLGEIGEYPIIFIDHEQIGNKEFSFLYAKSYFEFLSKIVAEMKRIYTPKGELKGGSE